MEARALAALLLVLLLAAPALAGARLDIYTKDGQRQGWAVVDERTGRLDLYSKDGKRLADGQVRDQHIDVFDKDSRRLDTIIRR